MSREKKRNEQPQQYNPQTAKIWKERKKWKKHRYLLYLNSFSRKQQRKLEKNNKEKLNVIKEKPLT